MIDLHSHVIYGIDDGAANEGVSTALLKMAVEKGTSCLIATPHVITSSEKPSWQTILEGRDRLRAIAAKEGLRLTIEAGAELELNWDMMELVQQGAEDYCLAGTSYILVELPAQTIPKYAEEFIYEMQLKDKNVIIAHPERHPLLQRHPDMLLSWLRTGVLLQCNAGSFTGMFGSEAEKFATTLLKSGVVSFIGSDAHRTERRNTDLSRAFQTVAQIAGQEQAQAIFTTNGERLLAGKSLYVDVPSSIRATEEKKKGFLSRFFG